MKFCSHAVTYEISDNGKSAFFAIGLHGIADITDSAMGINDLEFDFNEHGKPFLKHHPDIHFNLSHCKNGIAVAVDNDPIGIDIESFRNIDDALIRKTMNDSEIAIINASDDAVETFITYWTKKEAVLKLRGTGISTDLDQVLDGMGYRLETHINKEKRYVLSIAYSQVP